NRHRQSHPAPAVEVVGIVAGGEHVPAGAAEPGDDQRLAAPHQQLGDQRPAREGIAHWPNPLAPMTRWLTITAALKRAWMARSAAAANVSPTSAARSTGKQRTPIASSTGRAACPIGTCQGLNSPHCPRMVTSIRHGARNAAGRESALITLPMPEDCMA